MIVPDDVAGYLDGGWACVLRDDTQTRDRALVASASRRCASPNLLPKPLLLKVSRLANRYSSHQTNHPETKYIMHLSNNSVNYQLVAIIIL